MGKRVNTAQWMEKQQRWQIKVQKDNERKTFYSSKPGRTGQREANAKADAWLDENINSQQTRTKDVYTDYVNNLKKSTSTTNWKKAESIGRVWLLPVIGNKKIQSITEGQLQTILNNATDKGLAKKTVSNIKATILSFFKYCRQNKFTTLHPEFLSVPQKAKRSSKNVLQPSALAVLFTQTNTSYKGKVIFDPYIYAYRFEVLTGLRPGELIGLELTDIHSEIVYIQRSINNFGEITDGKNQNAKRGFALSRQAKNVLEQQLKIREPGNQSVFQILNQKHYRNCWKRYCAHNNIPYITPYELRHTFVSVAKNLSEGQIQPIIGHSKDMDTFGTYGHQITGEMEQTASELTQLFDRILKSGL